MSQRSGLWRLVAVVVAALFALVNLIGTGIAAARGELLHTVIHVALLAAGIYAVQWLAPRRVSTY